jgi:hypothetical protein
MQPSPWQRKKRCWRGATMFPLFLAGRRHATTQRYSSGLIGILRLTFGNCVSCCNVRQRNFCFGSNYNSPSDFADFESNILDKRQRKYQIVCINLTLLTKLVRLVNSSCLTALCRQPTDFLSYGFNHGFASGGRVGRSNSSWCVCS